jgi:phosphinothricin acetyltransferase
MRVRLATGGDAMAISEIYRPYVEDTIISFEATPPDADEMAARIATTLPRHPWLIAQADDAALLGYAYAHPFASRAAYAWSTETSVYLRQGQHRRGIGRKLYAVLLELLNAQGYREAFAGISLPNPASIALHEAMGFQIAATYRRVGFKHGAWHDVGWWQRGLDGAGPPSPLRTIDQLDPAELRRILEQAG